MQCILREKLLRHAMKLADVSNIYRVESHRFVDAYFSWIEEAEKDLSGLRAPISIILQSEKSLLTSVMDGYLPDYVQSGKSNRKNQKAVAARSLEKVSKEIYSKIGEIDRTLDQLNEQLCHAVAVLQSKTPGLYEKLPTSQQGVDIIWMMLKEAPETQQMYNYFCAKLAPTDKNYLLADIIQKIGNNTTA